MVEKPGGVMDNQFSLKEQLDTAIRRRDVAEVKRILQLSRTDKNKKRFKKNNSNQILLTLARIINRD